MQMKMVYFAIGLFAFVAAASAQTAPQTVEQVSKQANSIISALQTQRNNALDQATIAQAALAEAQKDLADAKKEVADLKAKAEAPATPTPQPAK
jgi:hypothetical protein